jgi:hypothetical protein
VGGIGPATSPGGNSSTSTLRGCAGYTPSGPAIGSGTVLFWVDRGAGGGYALQRSEFSTTWSPAIPVWPNASHANSQLFVDNVLTAPSSDLVVAASMDSSANLFVVTGGAFGSVFSSTNPRAVVATTPIAFHQLIRLGAGSTATAQFENSVYRGVTVAPTFCNIANNDFRRNLEAEEEVGRE